MHQLRRHPYDVFTRLGSVPGMVIGRHFHVVTENLKELSGRIGQFGTTPAAVFDKNTVTLPCCCTSGGRDSVSGCTRPSCRCGPIMTSGETATFSLERKPGWIGYAIMQMSVSRGTAPGLYLAVTPARCNSVPPSSILP